MSRQGRQIECTSGRERRVHSSAGLFHRSSEDSFSLFSDGRAVLPTERADAPTGDPPSGTNAERVTSTLSPQDARAEAERQLAAAVARHREATASVEVLGRSEGGQHAAVKSLGRALHLVSFVL